MDGKISEIGNRLPSKEDLALHLSTIFTENRLKKYIELRSMDTCGWDCLCAGPAFNVGILYGNLEEVHDLISNWDKDKIINFSSKFLSIEKEVKNFLKVNMYNNKTVQLKNNRGKKIVENLFKIIEKKPKKFIINKFIDKNKYRAISDYISGMTDRYAIQLYKSYK